MTPKTLTVLFLGTTILSTWPVFSSAHAFLAKAQPPVGAVIATPPEVVKIWFTSQVESDFSSIVVTDPQGKHVDKNDTQASDTSNQVLQVDLPDGLAPGMYKVIWKVIAIDGHKTSGDFYFTIK